MLRQLKGKMMGIDINAGKTTYSGWKRGEILFLNTKLLNERERVKMDANQRKKLNIVNRDMIEAEKRKVRKVDSLLSELVKNLNNGSVQLDDLDSNQLKILKKILKIKE